MSELLKKLFQPGRKVTVHELYKPSKKEERRYAQWTEKKQFEKLADSVRDAYRKTVATPDQPGFVRCYRHQSSNCISIHVGEEVATSDLMPLTRWLADRIRSLGYRLVNQDRIIRELPGHVQRKTRFYLKPPISYTLPADQKYGNVILELIAEDDTDQYIKCNVTSYNDRNYRPAGGFEEFLFKILD